MNFKDFLLKYTTINKKFINDFENVFKEDYIEYYNDFLIDSELLRKWLGITTHTEFKHTITKTYKENIDYIIKKSNKNNGSGGHNKKIFILTPEAAKKICLATKSRLGSEIRQYFIDIEFTLHKYKKYIIDGLNKKIKILENNQKSKNSKESIGGIIYVFKALDGEETSLYKIGRTVNSKKRFNSHNSPLANKLEVILIFETNDVIQLESCIKVMMKKAQYRKYKEIYQVDIDIIKSVIKDCDVKIKQYNNKINKFQNGGALSSEKYFLLIPNDKYN